ncbi:DUF6384 family protein [Pseudomonas sp. 210_17 TE3656]
MSKPLLSEQLGAMALVDELRHQQMQLQEHLDLPQRRAQVAAQIRAYYQRQGIHCDDDLVEQGVREFFARRLEFEAPELAWHEKPRARLLQSRAQWIPYVIAVLIMLIFIQGERLFGRVP